MLTIDEMERLMRKAGFDEEDIAALREPVEDGDYTEKDMAEAREILADAAEHGLTAEDVMRMFCSSPTEAALSHVLRELARQFEIEKQQMKRIVERGE